VMATVHVPVTHGIPIAHDNLRRRRNCACKHCCHGRSYNDHSHFQPPPSFPRTENAGT
jgi:hypothetical protein